MRSGTALVTNSLYVARRPPFAPPFLKAGRLVIAQTANILFYLGGRHGLAPAGEDGGYRQRFEAVVAVQPGRVEAQRFLAALHRAAGNPAKAGEHDARAESILKEWAADPAQRAMADRPSPRGPTAWAAAS